MTPRRIVLTLAGVLILAAAVWGIVAAGPLAIQILLSILIIVGAFVLYIYLVGVAIVNRWDWWNDFH